MLVASTKASAELHQTCALIQMAVPALTVASWLIVQWGAGE